MSKDYMLSLIGSWVWLVVLLMLIGSIVYNLIMMRKERDMK